MCAHLCLSSFKRVLEVRGNESDRGISKRATWPLNGALLKRRSPLEQVEKAVQPACLKRHFILKLQSCGGLAELVGNRAGGCKRKWVCSLEGHLSSRTWRLWRAYFWCLKPHPQLRFCVKSFTWYSKKRNKKCIWNIFENIYVYTVAPKRPLRHSMWHL